MFITRFLLWGNILKGYVFLLTKFFYSPKNKRKREPNNPCSPNQPFHTGNPCPAAWSSSPLINVSGNSSDRAISVYISVLAFVLPAERNFLLNMFIHCMHPTHGSSSLSTHLFFVLISVFILDC